MLYTLQARFDSPDQSVAEAAASRLVQRNMDLESTVKKHIEDYQLNLLTKIEVCYVIVSIKFW